MSAIRLQIENISKRYFIGEGNENREDTLYGILKNLFIQPFVKTAGLLKGHSYAAMGLNKELWAVKDVNLQVSEGEIVGIIGKNGAGKSTLLKILSRITPPTRGIARVTGRLSSLLEVGTGFHGLLTGRENVYLNGTILGMSKAEIDRKFDEIVDFSGVEEFIDTPARFYSSGMMVRLAFSVAAYLEPEILIIDEVLAVGDIAFHQKSMERMKKISAAGRTILLVSHQMGIISGVCDRVLLMDGGEILEDGSPDQVIAKYVDLSTNSHGGSVLSRTDREGSGEARLAEIWVEDIEGQRVDTVYSGSEVKIMVRIQIMDRKADLSNISVGISLFDEFGQMVTILTMHNLNQMIDLTGEEERIVSCRIPRFPINNGTIRIGCGLQQIAGDFQMLDSIQNVLTLNTEPGDFYGSGIPAGKNVNFLFDHEWS